MRQSQRGFSLSELTVTIGIAGIVALLFAAVSTLATDQYYSLRGRLEAEGIATRLQFALSSVFSQAIDIQYNLMPVDPAVDPKDPIPSGTDLLNNSGVIAHFNEPDASTAELKITQISDSTNPWVILALFLRETSTALPGAAEVGQPRKTALFFKQPSKTGAVRTAGIIFLDYGRSPTPIGPGALALKPTWDDDFYDRITDFEMTKHRYSNQAATSSVDFTVHVRYYRQSVPPGKLSWCSASDTLGAVYPHCVTTGSWADIEKKFSVILRNNIVRSSADLSLAAAAGQFEERVLGGLYFFNPVVPPDAL